MTWNQPWVVDALCAQADPDVFFPEHRGVNSAPAVNVCRRCPVQQPCLEYALVTREAWGIWGGATEAQRRHMITVGRQAVRA